MIELLVKHAPLVAVSLLSVTGSILLRANIDTPNENLLMGGLTAFFVSNFFWLQVLRSEGLGQAVILSTMLTTFFLILIGAAFFHEPIGQKQIASLIFATLALTSSLFLK